MLQTLHIENYALIRQADISFGTGFIVITGETGAGKSIMLGALGLLLGQRADTAVLADKENKCIVEAQFDISGLELQPLFAEADIDYDDQLVLRREITPAGKSRAFVNDTPVQLPFLKQLAPRIIDIHSQHQTLTLSDSAFRLSLLDAISASSHLADYRAAYRHYIALKRELETLTTTEAQNRRDADYLQFQFNELYEAKLIVGEQASLEQESQLLAHTEAVREGLATVSSLLDDDEGQAVLPRLRMAKSALSHIEGYHPAIPDLLARIDSALIELDDINSSVASLADVVSADPERQQFVDQRLALLYRLQQKHSVQSVEALIEIRDELDARLQGFSSLDARIHALMEQVDQAFSALQHAADALTASRQQAARLLAENILPTLHLLGMPDARFSVQLTPSANYGPEGHDSVALLFNANRGADLRDISKVASGGELSRLMLAIKSMLSQRSLLPTIIFDEIDTGVSGDIAISVGDIMRRMASSMQVMAISHLPQIAACAAQHFKVYKEVQSDSDRTVSRIRPLATDERVTEVAVMLSSDPPTEAALQTARELMQK